MPKCIFLPDAVFVSVTAITPDYLAARGITALVLDIDNTLTIHNDPALPAHVAAWLAQMRAAGIQLAVSSNNNEDRVAPFAQQIGVRWVANAAKPLPKGFKQARAQFDVPKQQMALVGDQLFTDVLGARLYGIAPLLVEPMAKDFKWYILLKRALEKPLLWLYYKKGGVRHG